MSQDQTDNLVISTRPYFITLLVCIFFGFLGMHLFLLDRRKRGLIYPSFWVFFILVIVLDTDPDTTTLVNMVAGFGAATVTFFWVRDIIFLLIGKMKDGSGKRTYSLLTYTEYVWKQKPKVQKTLETLEKAQNELEQKAMKHTQTINETRESDRLVNELKQQKETEEKARKEIEREKARQQREQEKAADAATKKRDQEIKVASRERDLLAKENEKAADAATKKRDQEIKVASRERDLLAKENEKARAKARKEQERERTKQAREREKSAAQALKKRERENATQSREHKKASDTLSKERDQQSKERKNEQKKAQEAKQKRILGLKTGDDFIDQFIDESDR